jgi:hypothetical protein
MRVGASITMGCFPALMGKISMASSPRLQARTKRLSGEMVAQWMWALSWRSWLGPTTPQAVLLSQLKTAAGL